MRPPSQVDVVFHGDVVRLTHDGAIRELSYAEHERWIVDGVALEEVFAAESVVRDLVEGTDKEPAPSFPLGVGEHLLLRPLGRGSFGEVFAAWDPLCGEQVAIKVLHRVDPWSLQAFKNEFRRLVTFSSVDSLLAPEELVEVRGRSALVMRLIGGGEIDEALGDAAGASGPLADEGRLRELTIDLVRTLVALHGGGLIHMDLKPGNIRVDSDGRVYLLDFGLARLRRRGQAETYFTGSPLYIAPEQLLRQPPTGAVDLYALGIILYVALTGEHPFEGSRDQLIARLEEPAPSLAKRRPGAGKLWAKIVAGLLDDRAARRLGAEELLALLGARPSKTPTPSTLLGRDRELGELRSSWQRVCDEVPSLVVLSGEPGVGKTELIRAFGDELVTGGEAAQVWCSCYESETVPYKTVDVLVEGLVELLLGDQERLELARELPGLARLAQVAPALSAIVDDASAGDGQEVAKGSRGEVLAAIVTLVAERAPLLLVIDDALWGDADSADLLAPLLTSPTLRRVMIVFTVRARDWESSPFGRAVESQVAKGLPCEFARREVRGLEVDEARALLRDRAPEVVDEAAIESVLRLAAGSPYLLEAYAPLLTAERRLEGGGEGPAGAQSSAPLSPLAGVRDGDIIEHRLADLRDDERRLIDTIAVAGAPIELAVAHVAAGVQAPSRRLLSRLRADRVLALDHRGGRRRVAIAHGLIRDSLLERIAPEKVRLLHSDLAQALLSRAREPGRIALHLYKAGRREEACKLGLRGAEEAESAGAYAQLADLLGLVIEAGREDICERERLELRQAKALAAAGRGHEAGEIYAALAASASASASASHLGEARALQRAAVESWMTVGEVARGLEALGPLLRELRIPKLRGGVLGLSRLVGKLGRLAFAASRVRLADHEDARAAERADTCWVGIKGLAMVEPVLALALMIDGLGYAAASGSRLRLGRAMGLLVGFLGDTPGLSRHVPRWLGLIEEWSADEPYLAANLPLWRSFRAHSEGDLIRAREEAERALELLEPIQEASWERVQAASCAMRALRNQGEYVALGSLCRSQLRGAERRGDLYAQVLSRLAGLLPVVARGGLREAAIAWDWVAESWLPDRYTVQTFYRTVETCYRDLYAGDPKAAADRLVRGRWPYLRSGGELIPFSRFDWRIAQGRVGLALDGAPRRGLMRVTKVIAQLHAIKSSEAVGNAELMAAALATRGDERGAALAGLGRAIEAFDSVGIVMEREVARLRIAELTGDRAAAEDATTRIRRLGVREPERWARVVAPGFPLVSWDG